jgi:hypothetical protein
LCGFTAGGTENIGRSGFELRFPGRDLVVELLRKLLSPWMAAIATFALKAGVWFGRGRRFMVSPDW